MCDVWWRASGKYTRRVGKGCSYQKGIYLRYSWWNERKTQYTIQKTQIHNTYFIMYNTQNTKCSAIQKPEIQQSPIINAISSNSTQFHPIPPNSSFSPATRHPSPATRHNHQPQPSTRLPNLPMPMHANALIPNCKFHLSHLTHIAHRWNLTLKFDEIWNLKSMGTKNQKLKL